MAIRNCVGARYVPKFADPVEWQANTSYEAMVIVTYNNSSYTSKVPVPPTIGNPAENSTYWALTGNYNAQVEEYRKATANAQEDINELKTKTGTNTNDISDLKTKDTEIEGKVNTNTNDISELKTNYASTETKLSSHINNKSNPHNVTAEQLGVAKTNIVDMIYPVGSIYMSVNNASPSTLFGGTWEQIQDKFLLASGPNYTNGTTGGSDTHTLNANELPAHTHVIPEHSHKIDELNLYRIHIDKEENISSTSAGLYINSEGSNIVERGMIPYRAGTGLAGDDEWVHTVPSTTDRSAATTSGSTGGGQAFSLMPPYIAVFVWKRIA